MTERTLGAVRKRLRGRLARTLDGGQRPRTADMTGLQNGKENERVSAPVASGSRMPARGRSKGDAQQKPFTALIRNNATLEPFVAPPAAGRYLQREAFELPPPHAAPARVLLPREWGPGRQHSEQLLLSGARLAPIQPHGGITITTASYES